MKCNLSLKHSNGEYNQYTSQEIPENVFLNGHDNWVYFIMDGTQICWPKHENIMYSDPLVYDNYLKWAWDAYQKGAVVTFTQL